MYLLSDRQRNHYPQNPTHPTARRLLRQEHQEEERGDPEIIRRKVICHPASNRDQAGNGQALDSRNEVSP